jgi:hypothetical protein
VSPVQIAHWGTFITTRNISASSATVDLAVQIENKSNIDKTIKVVTEVYLLDEFNHNTNQILCSSYKAVFKWSCC